MTQCSIQTKYKSLHNELHTLNLYAALQQKQRVAKTLIQFKNFPKVSNRLFQPILQINLRLPTKPSFS